MARYIDLNELLTFIDKRNGRLPSWLDEILMDDCKVADVEPVRHGEWQEINGIFRCSLCGYSFEHEGYQHFFNFCPNCGAKIDC